MYENIIFISDFIIAYFIIYIFKLDLKKFNLNLYEMIDQNIFIKFYLLILIGLIHFSWLVLVLFFNYNDNTLVYGFPCYLILIYLIYLYIDHKIKDKNMTIISQRINNLFNKMIKLYFTLLIIFLIFSNKIKCNILDKLQKCINEY